MYSTHTCRSEGKQTRQTNTQINKQTNKVIAKRMEANYGL